MADRVAEGDSGVGDPAPNFAFILADGRGADLASLRGKPVVLNFWATWCGPCRAEMPDLVALHEGNADVVVLEVNVREELAAIEDFAAEFGMTMPSCGSGGRDWPRLRRAQHADDRFHQSRRHDRRPLAGLPRRRAVDRVRRAE